MLTSVYCFNIIRGYFNSIRGDYKWQKIKLIVIILNSFRALGRKLAESCNQTQDLTSYVMEEQKKMDIINAEVQEERQKASRITVKILNKEDLTDEDRLILINKLGQGWWKNIL